MSSKHISKIAIVGGSGTLGQHLLAALLATFRFQLTAISRLDSTSTFPDAVQVARGDYNDDAFLTSALSGQGCLIVVLGHTAAPDLQSRLVRAAAKANVPWILPTEFGSDGANDQLVAVVPVLCKKPRYRKEVEELGVSKWIGIACNPLYEFSPSFEYSADSGQSLRMGAFKIDIPQRKATLFDAGAVKFNTTTFSTLSRTVAALLTLSIKADSPDVLCLSRYANKFAYVSSFHITQREMLDAVQTATATTDADWTIEQQSAQEAIDNGHAKLKKGNFRALVDILYAAHFKQGLGRDLESTRELVSEVLEIPEEDLVEVTKSVVESME